MLSRKQLDFEESFFLSLPMYSVQIKIKLDFMVLNEVEAPQTPVLGSLFLHILNLYITAVVIRI